MHSRLLAYVFNYNGFLHLKQCNSPFLAPSKHWHANDKNIANIQRLPVPG
jgi:hypothetical protein